MSDQAGFGQIPPPPPTIDQHDGPESFYSGPFAGVCQAPLNPVEYPVGPASFPAAIPVMPSMQQVDMYQFRQLQEAVAAPSESGQADFSKPLPLRTACVRNGQPTPPLYDGRNMQQLASLDYFPLPEYQVDGFQPVNVPPPPPPPPCLEMAPCPFNGNFEQPSLAKQGRSKCSSPPRRRRNSTSGAGAKAGVDSQKASRSKFLERNRLAASKCRQKKKDQSNHLLAECEAAEMERKRLTEELARLETDIINLKTMLFRHVDCKSEPIDAYLAQLVVQVATKYRSAQPSPDVAASEYVPMSTPSPDTGAFGFDGPVQYSPASADSWEIEEIARRASMQSMDTDLSYCFVDGECADNVEPEVDFDNLLDVSECA